MRGSPPSSGVTRPPCTLCTTLVRFGSPITRPIRLTAGLAVSNFGSGGADLEKPLRRFGDEGRAVGKPPGRIAHRAGRRGLRGRIAGPLVLIAQRNRHKEPERHDRRSSRRHRRHKEAPATKLAKQNAEREYEQAEHDRIADR